MLRKDGGFFRLQALLCLEDVEVGRLREDEILIPVEWPSRYSSVVSPQPSSDISSSMPSQSPTSAFFAAGFALGERSSANTTVPWGRMQHADFVSVGR